MKKRSFLLFLILLMAVLLTCCAQPGETPDDAEKQAQTVENPENGNEERQDPEMPESESGSDEQPEEQASDDPTTPTEKEERPEKQEQEEEESDGNEETEEGTDIEETVPAAQTDNPTFVVENVHTNGSKKSIPVKINLVNNPGIASVGLKVSYDRTKLKLVNYCYNPDIGGQVVEFNEAVRDVKLVWLKLQNITGDMTFATLYFDVVTDEPGTYPVEITYNADDIYNIREANIDFSIVNGSVVVD